MSVYSNPWVGQHRPDHSAAVRITPLLYPQRKLINIFFLPKLRDLPQAGLDLRAVVFDFGFNPQNSSLQAYDTQYSESVMDRNFEVWGITGAGRITPGGAATSSLMYQIYHTHQGSQRQLANKWTSLTEAAGSAKHPFLLPHPYLFLKHDTVSCEMKNISDNMINGQLVLWGGEFD